MATITAIKERILQLDPASFQILCDAYLSREGYPNLVAFGTKSGTAKITKGTPDTYFCEKNGKYIFAEYTTQTSGLVEKIKADLKKCLDSTKTGIPHESLVEIVYCHTSANINPQDDCYLKELCSKSGVKLTLIGIDKLAEDLSVKYHSLVKDHLHLSIDTEQIQLYDDFLKQHDANILASPLNTTFEFRDKELSQISEAFKNYNIVLLRGPAGVGKTRLALEYAKNRVSNSSEIFFCIHNRSLPIFDDIAMFIEKPSKYFLFIDDANQLSQIDLIVDLVNKKDFGFDVQIIASVRDYAFQKVKDTLADRYDYTYIDIKPFTDEQIQTIIKDNYGITNHKYLDRIARIAEGNCRIAILAAKVSCKTNRLDSINDATGLYAEYYGKVLSESGLNLDTSLLKTAGIIAFLNSIHIDYLDGIMPVLTSEGLEKEAFIDYLYKLHDSELIDIYHSKAVVFSEQCMSNYVLKYVFCDKKLLSLSQMIRTCFSINKNKTINAVSTLINVFQSNDLRSFVESEIRTVWSQLANEQSPYFMEYIKAFYPVNQTETLIILNNIIESMESVPIDPDKIDTETGKNYQSVEDDILTIIGGFADTDNFESALDLFFKYYLKRPDLYIKFFHTFSTYFSVRVKSIDYSFHTQIQFIKKIVEYSDNWTNKYICLLYLDVTKELLKIEFSPIEPSRKGQAFNMYHISIGVTVEVLEYRKLLWNGLEMLSESTEYLNAIINNLRYYGKGIDDKNKDVIIHDADYICQMLLTRYSEEDLRVCLLADHLQDVFLCADYHTIQLESFVNSPKMKLYNLLVGPKYDLKIEYNDYVEMRRQSIIDYIRGSKNPHDTFVLLYNTYQECLNISDCDKYRVSEGICIALQALSDSKEDYLDSAKMFICSETTEGINLLQITKNLFNLLNVSEVYEIISCAPAITANAWEYSYFYELPVESINQTELQKLYSFLQKDNDKLLKSNSSRDIFFVNKFSIVDENVLFRASEIILAKQSYSTFMVSIYFDSLFNPHAHNLVDVVDLFSKRISLLEEVYTCLESEGHNLDYNGEFLYEICSRDYKYLSEFAHMLVDEKTNHRVDQMYNRCHIFYNDENYIDIIDRIVNEAFDNTPIPEIYMPDIIKLFMVNSKDDENYSKIESWITHYIQIHSHDEVRMICLFSALSQTNLSQLVKYLDVLINNNQDYTLFEKIPLIPTSYSWSGSAVPVYSSWITHLESLLPLFHGIAFIKHKNRVENLISDYRKRIKNVEIMEVLKG